MSLINDARFNAGKGPLGFLNILFYKNPQVRRSLLLEQRPALPLLLSTAALRVKHRCSRT
jgi:hypothetical protein